MMRSELRAIALAVCLAYCAAPAFATDTARIQQSASNGSATINQVGNTGNADSVITQSGGDGNTAAIDQSGIAESDLAAIATAWIEQAGSGNSARISQTGSDMQDAYISQTGDRNRATLTTHAGRAPAGIVQSGNDNGADLTFDTSRSGLGLAQTGDGNYARLSEHDGAFFTVSATMNGNGNSAYIDVTGDGCIAETLQSGDYNELYVTQDNIGFVAGSENIASITQSTSFNVANLTQIGNSLNATIVQDTGNHNVANINQHF